MGERALENKVKKLQEIESQIKALEAEADKVREEIKAYMENTEQEEIQTKKFIIRFKEVVSNRFDTKAFKKVYSNLYKQYTKESVCKKFTIHNIRA